jgi:hypothetical protein
MAQTGQREVVSAQQIAKELAGLSAQGAGKGLWNPNDEEVIFDSVARACKTPSQRRFYLAQCIANGLSPIKGELFAIERKNTTRDGKQYKVITYVTSYHVFVSRARRAGLFLCGETVYDTDEFVFDAMAGTPVSHLLKVKDLKKRTGTDGLLGAWAAAKKEGTGEVVVGHYTPIKELLSDGRNPQREKMPGHFAWKTAICRMGRLVAPDLSSLYAAEEFGFETGGTPKERLVNDIPNPEPTDAAAVVSALEGQGAIPTKESVEDAEIVPDDEVEADTAETMMGFKERAELTKAAAMKGMQVPALLELATEKVGRPVADLRELTADEGAKLSAAVEG